MNDVAKIIALGSLALVGCQTAADAVPETGGAMASEPEENFIGYATMSADRILHVQIFRLPRRDQTMDYDLPPSHPNHAQVVEQADGVGPGETRRLRRIEGYVSMDGDGALLVNYLRAPPTGPQQGWQIDPPPIASSARLRPGDPGYAELLRRVVDLRPGETRTLYAGR